MSRKKKRIDREVFPDILYNNKDIEKFINVIMLDGKKTVARNILYKSFNYIKNVYNKNPLLIFSLALDNIAPIIEVKLKKYGNFKNNFVNVKKYRRKSLSMRWLKKYSRLRKEKFMYLKLANEIIDASKGRGESVKKKNSIHNVFNSRKVYKK